jgi:hypothetical protein
MAIACAYCNGEHDSPAQIRQCWHDNGQLEVPLDDGGIPDEASVAPENQGPAAEPRFTRSNESTGVAPARSMSRAAAETKDFPRGMAPAGPGPDILARHAVVGAGDEVAAPWVDTDRVVITADTLTDPGRALTALRSAHHNRRRVVIELDADFDRQPKLKTDAQPYEVGADFTFELE